MGAVGDIASLFDAVSINIDEQVSNKENVHYSIWPRFTKERGPFARVLVYIHMHIFFFIFIVANISLASEPEG